MKKICLLFIICFALNDAFSQEEAVLGHYLINPVLINPGATGFDQEHHNVAMHVRSGWTDFDGGPRTYAVSYDGMVGSRLGIGGMIYSENIASMTFFRSQLSFAFQYDANDLNLSAGFAAQFNRMQVDIDNFGSGPVQYQLSDEILSGAMDGERVFDASLGIYGSYKKVFKFGLSFPSLIRARLDEIESQSGGSGLEFFTLFAGGDFGVNDTKIKLQPSILVKNLRGVPFQTDFNFISTFLQDKFIAGLVYTQFFEDDGAEFGGLLGTKINNLRFIYSYDIYLGDFQKYNGGSHEITIQFQFNRDKGKFDRSKKYRK